MRFEAFLNNLLPAYLDQIVEFSNLNHKIRMITKTLVASVPQNDG